MSDQLLQLFTTQFSTNLEFLLQQMSSKLRGFTSEGQHVGKTASPVNQLGAVKLQTPAGRFAPMGRVDADMARRWVFPQDGELPQLIDSFDELKTIVDPKSKYATNASAAVGRAWDDAIVNAFFGTAYKGVDPSSFTAETWASFSSAYDVAVDFQASAATGLTVAKIIEARRILMHYENDLSMEDPTLVIGSTQVSDLLKQVQVVSTEYNDRPVMVDGKVTRFLGCNIVQSERLGVASNVRDCALYMKSGMYLGMWKDMTNRVSIRNDLSGEPWQLYTSTSYGATRLQAGKIIKIKCADTVAGPINP
jgi:hypothetical protein